MSPLDSSTGTPPTWSGPGLSAPRRPSSTSPVGHVVLTEHPVTLETPNTPTHPTRHRRVRQQWLDWRALHPWWAVPNAQLGHRAQRRLPGCKDHSLARHECVRLSYRTKAAEASASVTLTLLYCIYMHAILIRSPYIHHLSTDEQTPFSSSNGDVCAIRSYSQGTEEEESYIIGASLLSVPQI